MGWIKWVKCRGNWLTKICKLLLSNSVYLNFPGAWEWVIYCFKAIIWHICFPRVSRHNFQWDFVKHMLKGNFFERCRARASCTNVKTETFSIPRLTVKAGSTSFVWPVDWVTWQLQKDNCCHIFQRAPTCSVWSISWSAQDLSCKESNVVTLVR